MWFKSFAMCFLIWLSSTKATKPRPPTVTSFSVQHFFNDYLVAECRASGTPEPSITWMKDDSPLEISPPRIHLTMNRRRINITHAGKSDEGSYYCVVNNTYGVSRSEAKSLTKATLDSFPTQRPDKVIGHAGKHLRLECRGRPESRPAQRLSDYSWYIGKGEMVAKSTRITVDQTGNLHFLPLLKEDEQKNNATYNCSVFNAETRTRVYGSPTVVYVKTDTKAVPRNPTFVNVTRDLAVNEGDPLELQCIADGNPTPKLKWETPAAVRRNRRRIDEAVYSLSIDKIRPSDGGMYVCTAENSEGAAKRAIKVTVIAHLVSHISPTEIILPEATDQEFKCEVEEEGAVIAWYMNNIPVKDGRKIATSGNSLTIKNLNREEDTLSLQCHVTKGKRMVISDATLTVINETQIEGPLKTELYIPLEGKIDLNATATVDRDYQGDLQYIWYHNGMELRNSRQGISIYMQGGVSHATVDTNGLDVPAFQALLGEYECEVTIGIPSAAKRRKFVVMAEDPKLEPVKKSGSDGGSWWIGLIVAVLVCVIIIIVCLIIRNKGGVYPVDKRERAAGHDPVKELQEDRMHELTRIESQYDAYDDSEFLTKSEAL